MFKKMSDRSQQHLGQQQQQQEQQQGRLEVEQGSGRPVQNNIRNLKVENKRLKQVAVLFAAAALLATIGLIATIVIAVRQTNRASKLQEEKEQTKPVVTTVYYFDERTIAPGNGIVDPIAAIGDNDAIPVNENGSFVITAEDLLTKAPGNGIVDPISVNDNNNNN